MRLGLIAAIAALLSGCVQKTARELRDEDFRQRTTMPDGYGLQYSEELGEYRSTVQVVGGKYRRLDPYYESKGTKQDAIARAWHYHWHINYYVPSREEMLRNSEEGWDFVKLDHGEEEK